jgi:pimeloyl-ACP methyl ester carboxylesterase
MFPLFPPPLPHGTALLALTLSLSLALLILWLLTVYAYASSLLSPPRMTDGKAAARLGRLSPADLGYTFQTLSLPPLPSDPHSISQTAWWIPAHTPSARTAVLLHGYADAKVGALAWAPHFRHLGYNLLLPDLRAHGESGGTHTTAGVREATDLARLLSHLQQAHPTESRHLVLFGASLGAATISRLLTAPDLLPSAANVRAAIFDSPVASFDRGTLQHARLLALPGPLVGQPALRLARFLTGADFALASVARNLPRLSVPCLLILPQNDAFLSPRDRQALESAFNELRSRLPTSTLLSRQAPHLLTASLFSADYQQTLTTFLDKLPEPNLVSL